MFKKSHIHESNVMIFLKKTIILHLTIYTFDNFWLGEPLPNYKELFSHIPYKKATGKIL